MRDSFLQRWDTDWKMRRTNAAYKSTKEFRDNISAFANDLVREAARALNVEPESLRGSIERQNHAILHARINDIVSSYTHARNEVTYLHSEKFRVDWATSWDHFKFLLYRVATAIGIAAVILGTAMVADRYEIPLPLLRLTPLG